MRPVVPLQPEIACTERWRRARTRWMQTLRAVSGRRRAIRPARGMSTKQEQPLKARRPLPTREGRRLNLARRQNSNCFALAKINYRSYHQTVSRSGFDDIERLRREIDRAFRAKLDPEEILPLLARLARAAPQNSDAWVFAH